MHTLDPWLLPNVSERSPRLLGLPPQQAYAAVIAAIALHLQVRVNFRGFTCHRLTYLKLVGGTYLCQPRIHEFLNITVILPMASGTAGPAASSDSMALHLSQISGSSSSVSQESTRVRQDLQEHGIILTL